MVCPKSPIYHLQTTPTHDDGPKEKLKLINEKTEDKYVAKTRELKKKFTGLLDTGYVPKE